MSEPITHVAVIHAGGEPDYLYGLVTGLASLNLRIDVVDSDTTAEWFNRLPNVTFYNLRGPTNSRPLYVRAFRDLRYHLRLCLYLFSSKAAVIHIQWETRPYLFERFILLHLYRLAGKKIVFTAHNIDRYARDERWGLLYRRSLRHLYSGVDKVIVHTQNMKAELCKQFSIPEQKVAAIRHGINIRVPQKGISQREARNNLSIDPGCRLLLCFGNIARYKNIELLLEAFRILVNTDPTYRLVVAGRPKSGRDYVAELMNFIRQHSLQQHCILRFEFVPYDDVETYFMAADCLILPYRAIFQSGVMFLAYRFGLPVIATDIGGFRDDVVEGVTGFLSPPDDPYALAKVIAKYFESDLSKNLEATRQRISTFASERYSWNQIAKETFDVYRQVLR